jgi:hypothetical protein
MDRRAVGEAAGGAVEKLTMRAPEFAIRRVGDP